MLEIRNQESCLLIKGLANSDPELAQSDESILSVVKFQGAFLALFLAALSLPMLASIEAAVSSAVLNGP